MPQHLNQCSCLMAFRSCCFSTPPTKSVMTRMPSTRYPGQTIIIRSNEAAKLIQYNRCKIIYGWDSGNEFTFGGHNRFPSNDKWLGCLMRLNHESYWYFYNRTWQQWRAFAMKNNTQTCDRKSYHKSFFTWELNKGFFNLSYWVEWKLVVWTIRVGFHF